MKVVKVDTCKVVACYFGERREYSDKKLGALYECFLSMERTVNAGRDYDLIVVCPDVVNKSSLTIELFDYFDSINGTFIKENRKVIVHKRENIGASMGSFNSAFGAFKDKYKYWLFTEDDIVYVKENYLQDHIDWFNRYEKSGFVASLGIFMGRVGRFLTRHAGGACGLSTIDILSKVWDKFGSLPHSKERIDEKLPDRYFNSVIYGEIPFTGCLWKMAYKIIPAKCNTCVYFDDVFLSKM